MKTKEAWQCNACRKVYETEAEAAGCCCPMHTHARTKVKIETLKLVMAEYSDDELDTLGKRLGQALKLRRDREHRDRWQTEWGTKTNKGLVLTLREMIYRINCGQTDQI